MLLLKMLIGYDSFQIFGNRALRRILGSGNTGNTNAMERIT
jgi:hypothetical protein